MWHPCDLCYSCPTLTLSNKQLLSSYYQTTFIKHDIWPSNWLLSSDTEKFKHLLKLDHIQKKSNCLKKSWLTNWFLTSHSLNKYPSYRFQVIIINYKKWAKINYLLDLPRKQWTKTPPILLASSMKLKQSSKNCAIFTSILSVTKSKKVLW